LDRILRVVFGLIAIILSIINGIESTLSIILLIVGLLALVTSSVSFCPIYYALRIQTLKEEEEK